MELSSWHKVLCQGKGDERGKGEKEKMSKELKQCGKKRNLWWRKQELPNDFEKQQCGCFFKFLLYNIVL